MLRDLSSFFSIVIWLIHRGEKEKKKEKRQGDKERGGKVICSVCVCASPHHLCCTVSSYRVLPLSLSLISSPRSPR